MTQAALAAKLVAAGKAIGHIAKAGRNDFHKYDYVTDADVMDKVGAALDEVGVATLIDVASVVHEFSDNGQVFTTVQGAVSFIDVDDGATFVAGFGGTGTDKGDKGYYKAVTGGVKYAFLKSLRIPTGDDPEVETTKQAAPVARSTGPTPPQATNGKISSAQLVKLQASLTDAGLRSTGQKRAFTTQVLGTLKSSKDLTSAEMDTLLAALNAGGLPLENALAVV